eukprot:TRINITY_DN4139_c0_g1_i2.p1 TRINITY_DN4139_c0_g1~~TRINITY_DN4139_c0_g1_i2.p1  ORF type:complete len:260 (-),score=70.88 TRINITY_DN4139_c0_g1_i2:38-817(-)
MDLSVNVGEMKERCLTMGEKAQDFEFLIEGFNGNPLKILPNQDDLTLGQMLKVYNVSTFHISVQKMKRAKRDKKKKLEEAQKVLEEQKKPANQRDELILSLESMGFSTFRIRQEIANFEKGGKSNPTLEDMLAILLNEDPTTVEIESSRQIPSSPSSLPFPPSPTVSRPVIVSPNKQVEIQIERAKPSAPLLHEVEQDKRREDDDDCMVCFEKKRDCVLVPCGHLGFCYFCADGIHKSKTPECPLCRTKINIIVKTFRV